MATVVDDTVRGPANRYGRFARAIERRNLFLTDLALRGMGTPSLLVLVDYLELLADVRPDEFDRAAVRCLGRLELEASLMTWRSHSWPLRRW